MKKLAIWIVAWTLFFSTLDFWAIRQWKMEQHVWFMDYRTAMYEYVSWISPASFGLAENVYFLWLNLFDRDQQNWEWTFYSGNPFNPDGDYNFVYGSGDRYPMWRWYRHWLKNFVPWLALIVAYRNRRKIAARLKRLRLLGAHAMIARDER